MKSVQHFKRCTRYESIRITIQYQRVLIPIYNCIRSTIFAKSISLMLSPLFFNISSCSSNVLKGLSYGKKKSLLIKLIRKAFSLISLAEIIYTAYLINNSYNCQANLTGSPTSIALFLIFNASILESSIFKGAITSTVLFTKGEIANNGDCFFVFVSLFSHTA